MSLLEEARAQETRPGGLCGVARLGRDFGSDLIAEIEEAVAGGVQWTALAKALSKRTGRSISGETLGRHYAKKLCACWGPDGNPV